MPHRSMHHHTAHPPLAYFITIRTYGTWLPGDDRGWVDKRHNAYHTPFLQPDPIAHQRALAHLRDHPYLLATDSAALVEQTLRELCEHRHWRLHIVHARTNHVHTVLSASHGADRIMSDLKAWSTRRLREHGFATPTQTIWAAHGSTPHLYTDAQLRGAIDYVKNWQGGPLQKTWDQVSQEIDQAQAPRRAGTRSVSEGLPGARSVSEGAQGTRSVSEGLPGTHSVSEGPQGT